MRAALFSSILASSFSSGTTLPQMAAATAAMATTEPMIGQQVSTYVLAEPFDQWFLVFAVPGRDICSRSFHWCLVHGVDMHFVVRMFQEIQYARAYTKASNRAITPGKL